MTLSQVLLSVKKILYFSFLIRNEKPVMKKKVEKITKQNSYVKM